MQEDARRSGYLIGEEGKANAGTDALHWSLNVSGFKLLIVALRGRWSVRRTVEFTCLDK